MCLINMVFPGLECYAILITLLTIFRKEVTYKGLFFTVGFLWSVVTACLVLILGDILLRSLSTELTITICSINWFSLDCSLCFRVDMLSYFFVLLVTVIGLATNFYILNYMKYEAQEDIFALLINWFMFSMIVLLLSNNLFTLFLGWESIGLSSFFLINFWNNRRGTVKSSFKAFFFNKISDVFLFLFIVGINYCTSLNNLFLINSKVSFFINNLSSFYFFVAFSLFLCTLFKSAQLLGHLWLPDSMEAPVPASALIHSATLVSAGIYLLLRFYPIIDTLSLTIYIKLIGVITAAYGGLVAASQTDMKRLLAYSTISHCGFLFVTVGCGMFNVSLIYLFLHGLFKAATFFCAGSFIRVAGHQDTRLMGCTGRILPLDTITLIICSFNLGGLPFSFGYLYKSVFLVSLLNTNAIIFIFGFCLLGLLSSVVYTFRLVYYSAFDVLKDHVNPLVTYMQQKYTNVISTWSFSTYAHVIAVTIVLTFTVWFYISSLAYLLNSELTIDQLPCKMLSNTYVITLSSLLFKVYYEIFYSFYLLLIVLLSLIAWRYEYSYLQKLFVCILLLWVTLFFVVYTFFVKCGVIFWQKLRRNKILILVFPHINRKYYCTYLSDNIDDDFDLVCDELYIFL